MGAYDLKQALRHLPGADHLTIEHRGNGNQVISIGARQVEVGPMATNEDIERALSNPFIQEELRMSVIDRIKQKALLARNVAPEAIKRFEEDLDSILAEKAGLDEKRHAAVTPHQEAIAGVKGELDGLKSAIDILSNGGPA